MEEIGLRNWLKIYAKIGRANNISKFYRFVAAPTFAELPISINKSAMFWSEIDKLQPFEK